MTITEKDKAKYGMAESRKHIRKTNFFLPDYGADTERQNIAQMLFWGYICNISCT